MPRPETLYIAIGIDEDHDSNGAFGTKYVNDIGDFYLNLEQAIKQGVDLADLGEDVVIYECKPKFKSKPIQEVQFVEVE